MGDTEVRLSAMPEKMTNDGNCKSKIVLQVLEKGEPGSRVWLHVGTTLGDLYGLGDSELEKVEHDDLILLKVRTDEDGNASLGLRLPPKVVRVGLVAAAKKKGEVSAVLSRALEGKMEPKRNESVGLCRVSLEAGKPEKIVLDLDQAEVVADGTTTVTVTALVMDGHGNPIEGQEVSFESDLGSLDPERVNCITDGMGRTSTTISSQRIGLATVKSTNRYRSWMHDVAPDLGKKERGLLGLFKERSPPSVPSLEGQKGVLAAEATIRFVASVPSNIILAADRSSLPADGRSEACVSVEVKDEFGNPVEGERIVFETDLGEIRPSEEQMTGPDGKAVAYVKSTRVGAASVRASTVGGEALLSAVEVLFEAASPARIELQSDRDRVTADGKTECFLVATVADEGGNPVPGRTVNFETDLGTIERGGTATTDRDGNAEVGMVSRVAGKAHLKAVCGDVDASLEVEFEPGRPASLAMSLNPTVEEGWRERIPPRHVERLGEALKHLEERKFSEAIGILEAEHKRIEATSDYPALCDLAFAYQHGGRKSEAERLYRYLLDSNGRRKEIRVRAGELEEAFGITLSETNGRKERAPKEFMELDPRDYLINVVVTDEQGNPIPDTEVQFGANFGWVPDEFKQSRTNAAGAATSLVTTFTPWGSSEVEFAWVNLGLMKENALDYGGAERCYRSAIETIPGSMRAMECLASVLVKTGDIEGAKKCFYNLGRAYSAKGQLTKATEFFGKAIELDPKYARALGGYGAACLRLGETERARRYLEESVKLDKSLKAPLANLGLLYYLIGKFDKAIEMNKRALKLEPSFRPALMNLQQIHMANGERDKANEYSAKIRGLGG